jgi:hypothetical protein
MPLHDFQALYGRYDAVIAQMPAVFTSHQFILRLAHQNQRLYIDALDAYRHKPAPFMIVHGVLAAHLGALPRLEQLPDVASRDIFGQSGTCACWRKR